MGIMKFKENVDGNALEWRQSLGPRALSRLYYERVDELIPWTYNRIEWDGIKERLDFPWKEKHAIIIRVREELQEAIYARDYCIKNDGLLPIQESLSSEIIFATGCIGVMLMGAYYVNNTYFTPVSHAADGLWQINYADTALPIIIDVHNHAFFWLLVTSFIVIWIRLQISLLKIPDIYFKWKIPINCFFTYNINYKSKILLILQYLGFIFFV
jgi:hypothetical protein